MWIKYKNKRILYSDCTDLKGDGILEIIEATRGILRNLPKNSTLLTLDNFTNAYINTKVMSELKQLAEEVNELNLKSAAVGITGVKKVLLTALSKIFKGKLASFDTLEEAKEWLVKEL